MFHPILDVLAEGCVYLYATLSLTIFTKYKILNEIIKNEVVSQ